MMREVYTREQRFKKQIAELHIEIDETRKALQVSEITESPSTTPSTTPTVTPGGPNPVNFTDIIQEIHPDWWQVGGRTVRIDERTTIDQSLGTAEPGAEVKARKARQFWHGEGDVS